jgi:hypothetical protein
MNLSNDSKSVLNGGEFWIKQLCRGVHRWLGDKGVDTRGVWRGMWTAKQKVRKGMSSNIKTKT